MKNKWLMACMLVLSAQAGKAQITNPAPYCDGNYDGPGVEHYISNVTLGTLNNTSGTTQYPGGHYVYYNNLAAPDLVKGNTYTLSVAHDEAVSTHFIAVYIDFNHNNNFNDPGEKVLQRQMNPLGIASPATETITIPVTAIAGQTRMRVMVFEDDTYSPPAAPPANAVPCTTDATGHFDWGETEDYNVNITGGGGSTNNKPVAAFTVSATTGTTATLFTFKDNSTNNPTARQWTFTPNTVAYQGGTNNASAQPVVKFTATGTYTVKLKATNAAGSDSTTKAAYIQVTGPTAIGEISIRENALVFPNPASTVLNIIPDFKGADIDIYDVQGVLQYSGKAVQDKVDVSALANGLYYVKLRHTHGSGAVRPLVIRR